MLILSKTIFETLQFFINLLDLDLVFSMSLLDYAGASVKQRKDHLISMQLQFATNPFFGSSVDPGLLLIAKVRSEQEDNSHYCLDFSCFWKTHWFLIVRYWWLTQLGWLFLSMPCLWVYLLTPCLRFCLCFKLSLLFRAS